MRRVAIIAIVLALLAPSASRAQAAGAESRPRVRVRPFDGARVEGRLTRLDADSVGIAREGAGVTTVWRQGAVIEIGRPRSTGQGALRGVAYGLLAGGVTGAIVGYAAHDEHDQSFIPTTAGEDALILGALGGLAGGAIGALIGAAVPGTQWRRVPEGATSVFNLRVTPRSIAVRAPLPRAQAVTSVVRRARRRA
jgi:hypothetical protein